MSKISKSIVISEFLWLLFFAVVFLKFDYTRTTLAVVNAIVWLCIVLVFSIIILQFLTRQAFTKVRGILLVLIFLIIDQVIKALLYFAPSEISIPVIPNILSILVILNKYQTLVLQAADKFASPYIVACAKLMLLPFFLLLLYLLSKSKNRFNFKTPIGYAGVTLISSAILSTVLDSLIYKGTPDYFYLIPLYSSVDLKDVFAFLGAGCILSIISTNEKNSKKNFRQRFMYGLCDFEVIDDDIAQWHESTECACELHEYLGLTEEEYSLFVRSSDELENRLLSQRQEQRFRIYQLDVSLYKVIPFAFVGIKELQKAGHEYPPAAQYRLIHDGMLHCEETASDTGRLTRIAELFGDALPKDYRGRSVAPSDVIELYDDTGRRYFYRDTDGFCPVKFSPMLAKK